MAAFAQFQTTLLYGVVLPIGSVSSHAIVMQTQPSWHSIFLADHMDCGRAMYSAFLHYAFYSFDQLLSRQLPDRMYSRVCREMTWQNCPWAASAWRTAHGSDCRSDVDTPKTVELPVHGSSDAKMLVCLASPMSGFARKSPL